MIKAIDLIKKKMYFKMLAMLFSISSTSLKIVRTLMFFDVFVDYIFYPFKTFTFFLFMRSMSFIIQTRIISNWHCKQFVFAYSQISVSFLEVTLILLLHVFSSVLLINFSSYLRKKYFFIQKSFFNIL